jgi:tetratricopeptide (TPR) repeat protein
MLYHQPATAEARLLPVVGHERCGEGGAMGGIQLQKAYRAILNSDFEQAAQWFERAIEAEPDNADYHYRLSITYARSNKLPGAVEHAAAAARLAPGCEQYRLHLAILRARELLVRAERDMGGGASQPHYAAAMLKQAIALDPLCVEAYLLLAVAADRIGDAALAIRSVHDALRLDPHNEAALALLPQLERKLKHFFDTDAGKQPDAGNEPKAGQHREDA